MLSNNTFVNKDLVKYINNNYCAAKLNGEGSEVVNYKGQRSKNKGYDPALVNRRNSIRSFTSYLQVQAYPTMPSLNENADLITNIASYMTPSQLEMYSKLFATNDYKEAIAQQEFQDYQDNLKNTFKAN